MSRSPSVISWVLVLVVGTCASVACTTKGVAQVEPDAAVPGESPEDGDDAATPSRDAMAADASTAEGCRSHGECSSGECNTQTRSCKGAPGKRCDPATGCASAGEQRYACDARGATSRCVPTGRIGDYCTKQADCPERSSCTNDACIALPGETGDSCTKPSECRSEICFYGACRADYGDSCSDGVQCRPADLDQIGPDITVLCYDCSAATVMCTNPAHLGECLQRCPDGTYRASCP